MPASRFRSAEHTRPVHDHGQPVTLDYEALWLTGTTREAAIEAVLDTLAPSRAG
jgi:hypothetical protein